MLSISTPSGGTAIFEFYLGIMERTKQLTEVLDQFG